MYTQERRANYKDIKVEENQKTQGNPDPRVIQEEFRVSSTTDLDSKTLPAQPAATGNNSRHHKKKIVFAILFVLLIFGTTGLAYWYTQREKDSENLQHTSVQNSEQTDEELDSVLQRFITPKTGEKWLASPKKIASQGYRNYPDGDHISYYEVGSRDGKTIHMSVECGVHCNDISLYERSSDATVVYISRPDGQATYDQETEKLSRSNTNPSIRVDNTTHYDSMSMPKSLEIEHGYKVTKPEYATFGEFIDNTNADEEHKSTEIKTYGSSKIVQQTTTYIDTQLTSIAYSLDTPIGTRVTLEYEPVPTDLSGYQWTSGVTPSGDKLKAIARGCGGSTFSVTRSDTMNDTEVQKVGTSSDGQDIYGFKDANHILINKAYEEFTEFTKEFNTVPYNGISKTDFVAERGIVLAKDKYGQWLVYVREQLAPDYGCAKPVIYLYPTSPQSINVRVGADVKVSDPLYPTTTGWQNVIAQPNGELMYNGRSYRSLFWEGPGSGRYPGITSGTIVARQDALETIKAQLSLQGLSGSEIADFVDYWQDKLPNKPYVRLTWFNTTQLNQLAPLFITPKPDTVIRVFLDFAGLDAPIDLPPQEFTAVPRKGFTVVEWGGLSPTKLY